MGFKRFWNKLSKIGVRRDSGKSSSMHIMLTNRFSIIAALTLGLILILLFTGIPTIGWNISRVVMLVCSIIFFCVPLVNYYGKYTLAKWVISWLPAILIILISIIDKSTGLSDETLRGLFVFRFFLMATAIIPVLIFSSKEIKVMMINLIPSFVGTVFFDVIHRPFGVGINQLGFDEPQMYLMDTMIGLAYIGMVGFLLHQRYISDKFELKLHKQQVLLKERNREHEHKNAFINQQNFQIVAQSDELKTTNDALIQAKQTIEFQNKNLEEQVKEKAKDLLKVNEELVINNNELRQFSYTLSHNLKAPVTTIQGLLNLIEKDDLNDANIEILQHMSRAIKEMHTVFSDMNEMLELRNQLYSSTEDINIQHEIDKLCGSFYMEFRRNNIQFSCAYFGDKILETNAEKLQGMLFQLLSNAVKFRSENRNPEIKISFNGNGNYHSIKIWDNGKGIDLKRHGDKLFFPYQQFHKNASGKGLGLYMVKLQAESLGGSVKVDSRPEEYTEVEILLKK